MQLNRLQMRNFKRFRHQDILFRDGITGIIGNNGAGKSTIVDAVLFCLYGLRETGVDHVISVTADPGERAEVRLDFSVRGEEYQIVRSLDRRKRHEVQVYRGGRLFARGVSDAQDALMKIVRMGHADFRHTIFSGQRELLTLVEATPESRKRWFRRVLGIDSLKEEGGEILRGETLATRDELLRIEGRLMDADADGIRKAIGEAAKGIDENGQEIHDLRAREEAHAVALASLEEEVKGHRDREKRAHGIGSLIQAKEKEAAGLETELRETGRRLAALGEYQREYMDLAGRENGFMAIQERYLESTVRARTFGELTARISEKKARIAEVEHELTRLREEEARLRQDEEMIKMLAPAIARRGEIQARLHGLRKLEERSRTLVAGIGRRDATLEELARRGGYLRDRIREMREARGRLGEMARREEIPGEMAGNPVSAFEARRMELQQTVADGKAGRDHAVRHLGEVEARLSTITAEGAGGTCPTCRQPLGDRYGELVEDIRGEVAALRAEVEGHESAIRQAEKDLVSVHSILQDARRLRESCSQLDEIAAEWGAIQDQTLQEIAAREELDLELTSLGYDPAVRGSLEEELEGLEAPWRESLTASERLKAGPDLDRRMERTREILEQLRKESGNLAGERDLLGFDPGVHRGIEEEYRAAGEAHRRYLELKPAMEEVPILVGQKEDLISRAASAGQAIEGLRNELAAVGFSGQTLREAESMMEADSRQALELGRRLERAQAERSRLEEDARRLAEILARLDEDTGNRDRLREQIQLLELTRDQLNGFTDHLLGVVRDQIQDEAGRILSEITDGRYDTVIIDDAFELLVHDMGGDYPVSRFSGGEQDDVALALRIALSRYIAEIHELHDSTFLIFDEIFGSQDEERRSNIFRALRSMEPFFPQIFLISHIADVQGEFGNTLIVEAVSGEESRVRDLEETP